MRISNAFHTYDLVFLFLTSCLQISIAWGKGKYFSDYEYPEIQQLFIAKEEAQGEEGSKNENSRTVQEKSSFVPVLDSDVNDFLETSNQQKFSNKQISKPWMRAPYADYINNQKTNNDDGKIKETGEINFSEASHNNQFREIPAKDAQDWANVDKPRKQLSDYVNSHQESNRELGNDFQPKRLKYRKRVNPLNHNRISSLREDANKRLKNHLVRAWNKYDADLSHYEGSDTVNGIESKQNISNVNDKLLRESRVLPEYEGNVQEYDELIGVHSKNEAMSVINQPSTALVISQTKEEVISSAKQIDEGFGVKMISSQNRSTVTNEPFNVDSTHIEAAGSDQGTINKEIKLIKSVQSLATENSYSISKVFSLAATTSSLLTAQEMNLQQNIPNVSQADIEVNKESGMLLRQPNRALPENHQLLAKPPVKIAGTLMEKHSEDDSESNVEEKGAKMVKVAQINSIVQSSTVSASTGNIIPNNVQKQANSIQFVDTYDPSRKEKRNVNENKTVDTNKLIREKLEYVAQPEKALDKKKLGKDPHSELTDASFDVDTDETSEWKKSKFVKPHYYSLSKSNSALGMFHNFMTKLKSETSVKKKKHREEKLKGSLKRNAPITYDLSYNSGNGYYKNKNGRKSDPIRTYYDYENYYDSDYKDREYPKASHLKHTALAAEKELDEYSGDRHFSNFSRNNIKSKRKKYRKVEETYRDIFAHPLSLDDPELQIVRDDEDELVKRRMQHKNYVTRHHRERLLEKGLFPQYQRDSSAKLESLPRSHSQKRKGEHTLHQE